MFNLSLLGLIFYVPDLGQGCVTLMAPWPLIVLPDSCYVTFSLGTFHLEANSLNSLIGIALLKVKHCYKMRYFAILSGKRFLNFEVLIL